MAAAGFNNDVWKLDKVEAKELAESIGNVASHYAVEVNPKFVAWAGLLGVIGAIYGPRIALMRVAKPKKGEPQKEEVQVTPANVTPIVPQPFIPPAFGGQGGVS
jgi:hypothetical protein